MADRVALHWLFWFLSMSNGDMDEHRSVASRFFGWLDMFEMVWMIVLDWELLWMMIWYKYDWWWYDHNCRWIVYCTVDKYMRVRWERLWYEGRTFAILPKCQSTAHSTKKVKNILLRIWISTKHTEIIREPSKDTSWMREDTYSKCRISILPKLGKSPEPSPYYFIQWVNG